MDMSGMDMATSSSSMDMSGMDMATSSSSMDMSGMDMATSSSSMDMGGVVSSSHMTMSSTPLSSMTTAMMTMSSASASSASSMDMAGMVMASSSTSSLASAATSDSMSSMDMSGSDSSDSSQMQMWMTTTYRSTPVFFRTLKASSGGAAFGIFCVLFFSSFFFRGLLFLSSYLEQAVFHNFSNTIIVEDDCECGPSETDDKASSLRPQKPDLSFGSVLKQLFWTSRKDLLHDVIRLVLAFTIVMFGYAIMLAAMSFVILYFFAICLGLAFGEVFFNRLAVILDINKSFGACSGLH